MLQPSNKSYKAFGEIYAGSKKRYTLCFDRYNSYFGTSS